MAGSFLRSPGRLERLATRALVGVGGDREWWIWRPAAHVGHLRVDVTPEEYALIPPGCALSDAGETGLERRRKREPP
ncbi:MAG: hypothetical protein ACXV2H_07160 [Actinomycetes bacterium]